MSYLFYLRKLNDREAFSTGNLIDPGYTVTLWNPDRGKIIPPKVFLKPFVVWWLFHKTRTFANRDYAVLNIYKRDTLVHRTGVFPRYFRFPFMAENDLQLGDTWTASDHRSRGLATYAINLILQLCAKPGRSFWYIVEDDNKASIRVIEKSGFSLVGEGVRVKRIGLALFGAYVIRH